MQEKHCSVGLDFKIVSHKYRHFDVLQSNLLKAIDWGKAGGPTAEFGSISWLRRIRW